MNGDSRARPIIILNADHDSRPSRSKLTNGLCDRGGPNGTGSNPGFRLFMDNDRPSCQVHDGTDAVTILGNGFDASDGLAHGLVMTWAPPLLSLWYDGIVVGTDTDTLVGSLSNSENFGYSRTSGSLDLEAGSLGPVGWWDRALGPGESRRVSRFPHRSLSPSMRLHIPPTQRKVVRRRRAA